MKKYSKGTGQNWKEEKTIKESVWGSAIRLTPSSVPFDALVLYDYVDNMTLILVKAGLRWLPWNTQ